MTNRFTTVYQAIPPATDAPPAMRDLIDMTDATAQAALKKAIAIDAAADQLMNASDQLAAELAVAAPGTAPMIEAQSAAMLVKAHALTQSATAELVPHSSDRYGEYRGEPEVQRESRERYAA